MPIEVACPSCDTSHKVKDESAGKKLKCKGCQAVLSIPSVDEDADLLSMNLSDHEHVEQAETPAPQSKHRKSGTASKGNTADLNAAQRFLLYGLRNPWVGATLFFFCVWLPLSFVFTPQIMLADVAVAALCLIGLIIGFVLALIGVTIRNPFQMLHWVAFSALVALFVPRGFSGIAGRHYGKATRELGGKDVDFTAATVIDTGIAGSIAGNCGFVLMAVVVHLILFFTLKNAGIVTF